MRNNSETKIKQIMTLTQKLPCFVLPDLVGIENDKNYLRVLFYRYKKIGKLITLKKGLYTTKEYVDNIAKSNRLSFYSEFVGMILQEPSYLSLDYVLYDYNILTEVPENFTLISKKKTAHFSNQFGNFFYHTLKPSLFYGFKTVKKGDFTIYKATKAKALFDFLYLRKYSVPNKEAATELRLNLNTFNRTDKKELDSYVKNEGSERMVTIMGYLFS